MILKIFLLFTCHAELLSVQLDRREANAFLTRRGKRANSRRGEEGSVFNKDDNLERECKKIRFSYKKKSKLF